MSSKLTYKLQRFDKDLANDLMRQVLFLGKDAIAEEGVANPDDYAPNVDQIWTAWEQGIIIPITATDEHGVMVGYQMWLAVSGLLFADRTMAILRGVYLQPEHRRNSMAFLRFGIETLKAHFDSLQWEVHKDSPLKMVADRLGFVDYYHTMELQNGR